MKIGGAQLLVWLASACAWMSAWIIWRQAQRGEPPTERTALLVGAGVAVAILAAAIAVALQSPWQQEGIRLSFSASVTMAALLVLGSYFVGLWRHGVQGLGLFVLPVAGIALGLAPLLPEAHAAHWLQTRSPVEAAHFFLSLLGFAVLTLAAAHAAMQLVLDRALKRKRLDRIAAMLPSLVEIERHLSAQVVWATALIGASLLTGLGWQWETMARLKLLDHKVLFSLFGFGVLVLLLIKRRRMRWSATTTSRAVLAAYALIAFGYFGVRFIHNLLH